MKDRLITLGLAVGALAAFYAVLVPKPDTLQERVTRPLSTEAGPNGYLGLQRWLANEGIPVVSLRERYGALATIVPGVPTGNLLITTAPHVYPLRNSEVRAAAELDRGRQHAGRAGRLVRYAGMVDGRRPGCAIRRSHEGHDRPVVHADSSPRAASRAAEGRRDAAASAHDRRQPARSDPPARTGARPSLRPMASIRCSMACTRCWPFPNFQVRTGRLRRSVPSCWSSRAIMTRVCRRCG